MKKIVLTLTISFFVIIAYSQQIGTEVLSFSNNCANPTNPEGGVIINTNLPFTGNWYMATVIFEGFNYGTGETIGLTISWHPWVSNGAGYFASPSLSSSGGYSPEVYLYNSSGKVSVFLKKGGNSNYCINFKVRSWVRQPNDGGDSSTWFTGWSGLISDVAPAPTSAFTKFEYKNGFGTAKFVNGNLGIGTTNPDQKLTVKGGIGFDYNSSDKKLYSPEDGILEWMTHDLAAGKGFVVSHQGQKRVYLSINGNSYLNGGNVGIGTTSPDQKLTIKGGVGFDFNSSDKKLYSPEDGTLEWMTNDLAVSKGFAVSHQGQKRVYLSTSGNSYLNGGRIGFGTSNPSANLEIFSENGAYPILKLNSNFSEGNSVDINNFIQGVSNNGFEIRIDGSNKFAIANNGNVSIGTTDSKGYKLAVDGSIIAEKVKVKNSNVWPDFVFKKDYTLPTLSEIERFVNENRHLPEIPSAAEVDREGQDLGEMNRLLLKKVEELTLYLIIQQKEIELLKPNNLEIESIKKQLNDLKSLIRK